MKLKQLPNRGGALLWEGSSLLNGEPIFMVATLKSANVKTGNMIQTWILPRDIKPTIAVQEGSDASVCGDCPHRKIDGKRTCYVNVGHGPRAVWNAYKEGKYPRVKSFREITKNRRIRFGAYGDPAAVPTSIWTRLRKGAAGWTGYTHQWRTCDQGLREECMASVDNEWEARIARRLGWRTFRCRTLDEPLMEKEIMCPASEEAGKKTTCDNCLLCAGSMSGKKNKIPDISIVVHGPGAIHFD